MKLRAYGFLLLTFCFWGSSYVVSKFVMNQIPAFTVSLMQYVVAVAVLMGAWLFKKRRSGRKKVERSDYKYFFLIGFLGYFMTTGAQLLGTKFATASLASLINSLNPVMIMLAATLVLKEQLTFRKIVSIAAALLGVYLVIGGVDGSGMIYGILLSALAVVLWAFVSVIIKKMTQKYDPLQVTAYGMLIGTVCTVPVAAVEWATAPVRMDGSSILAILYMGAVCMGAAHFFWGKSLSVLDASICSMFYPLQPMISVLLGALFLGESINLWFVIGAALIVSGVLFCILTQKRDEQAERTAETEILERSELS